MLAPGPSFRYTLIMRNVKRKLGRPSTGGAHPLTAVRLPDQLRKAIDRWAKTQGGNLSRSEAIRRLVEVGLTHAKPLSRLSQKAVARAANMAAGEIDRRLTGDPSLSTEERSERKRRLLKGPKEFRNIRGDQANR